MSHSSSLPVAVVGGGIIGTAIAWRLAQRGFPVTIWEKGKHGQEASWAAAGMLAPGGESDEESPLTELFLESRRMYGAFVNELSAETGLAVDFSECGAIELAYGETEWAALQARAARQANWGIRSRALAPDRAQAFSPYIETTGLTGAIFYPGDGIVAPRDLLTALAAACRGRGVTLRERRPVSQMALQEDSVTVNGEKFQSVVLAAGAWSGSIAVSQADGTPANIPATEPVKGHILGFDLQLGACPTIVRHGHIYVFQRGSGLMVAGASMEQAGFDRTLNASISENLHKQVERIMPVVEKLSPVDVWTGLRPKSDALHIGRWRDTRLFLAYGHFRNGILLAPLTAEKIASEIAR